jgi:hypothetical protein
MTTKTNCFILIADEKTIGIVKDEQRAKELMNALEYDNRVNDANCFVLIPTYHSAFEEQA